MRMYGPNSDQFFLRIASFVACAVDVSFDTGRNCRGRQSLCRVGAVQNFGLIRRRRRTLINSRDRAALASSNGCPKQIFKRPKGGPVR